MNPVRKEAKKIAEALLYACDISAPPVRFAPILRWMKENMGFEFKILPSDTYLDSEGLAGKLVRRAKHIWILLNGNDSMARQRFTLGHELGHFMENLQVAHMSQVIPKGYSKERFADIFASELLMPGELVKHEWSKLHTTYAPAVVQYKLAMLFSVSNEAMGYRLNELGLQSLHWSETSVPPVYE